MFEETKPTRNDLLEEIDRLLAQLRGPGPGRTWETPWFSSDIGPIGYRHTPAIIVEPTFTNVSRLT